GAVLQSKGACAARRGGGMGEGWYHFGGHRVRWPELPYQQEQDQRPRSPGAQQVLPRLPATCCAPRDSLMLSAGREQRMGCEHRGGDRQGREGGGSAGMGPAIGPVPAGGAR